MALTVDKIKFGNKSIADAYFGDTPVKEIYFGKTLIWQKSAISRELVAGNQNIAIAFTPESDTVVNTMSVFTTQSGTGTGLAKIIHEGGFLVGYSNGNDQKQAIEKYGLQGWLWTTTFSTPVALYAKNTYYIVYQGTTNELFYPAYFKNQNGNYKYPYANTTQSSTSSAVDFSSLPTGWTFKGLLSSTGDLFILNENDLFTWWSNESVGLTKGNGYLRSSLGTGYEYTDAVGTTSQWHTMDANDITAILAKSTNDCFQWNIHSYSTVKFSDIVAVHGDASTIDTIDFSSSSDVYYGCAQLAFELNEKSAVVCAGGSFFYGNYIGLLFRPKAGYTSQVASMTPLAAEPENPVEKGMYYLASGTYSGLFYYTAAVWVYENGTWTLITVEDGTGKAKPDVYFDIIGLNEYVIGQDAGGNDVTYLEDLGGISDMVKPSPVLTPNLGESFLDSPSLGTDKKFYLEINGQEV